tara:strand:- start:1192 stop:1749 length:558 start_codon:yes stop_codon:yes gene_type:complete
MAGMDLTPKQEAFVQEYLIDLNATQAAIRAGYSEKTANEQGSRLLANVKIAKAIAEAKADRSERTGVTQDMVIAELAKIGFSDLRKVLTNTGQLIDPQDWDDETAGAISSIEIVTNSRGGNGDDNEPLEYTSKIKTWDKPSALDKLGRHLGLYAPEKIAVTVEAEVSPSDKLTGFLNAVASRKSS